jgi:hypothetical protein
VSRREKPQSQSILEKLSGCHDYSLCLILYDALGVRVVAGTNPAAPTNP